MLSSWKATEAAALAVNQPNGPHGKECALRQRISQSAGVHATGQLRGHGLHGCCRAVNITASLFFEVLYNDKGVSALRPELCGPIVLTGSLLQYSRCSPGAALCSPPPNKQPLCISTYWFLFVPLWSAEAKPSCILSQRWIKPCWPSQIGTIFVLKCAPAGGLIRSITHDRQSAAVFITEHMMSGNQFDLCLSITRCHLLRPGSLKWIVSFYTRVLFCYSLKSFIKKSSALPYSHFTGWCFIYFPHCWRSIRKCNMKAKSFSIDLAAAFVFWSQNSGPSQSICFPWRSPSPATAATFIPAPGLLNLMLQSLTTWNDTASLLTLAITSLLLSNSAGSSEPTPAHFGCILFHFQRLLWALYSITCTMFCLFCPNAFLSFVMYMWLN